MTVVAIFFEPLFFPSVYRGWVSSFFCFADHVAGIEISVSLLSGHPSILLRLTRSICMEKFSILVKKICMFMFYYSLDNDSAQHPYFQKGVY
jgi:hypothetical protein